MSNNITFIQKRNALLIEVLWNIFDDEPLKGIEKAKELGFFDEARNMEDTLQTLRDNDKAKEDAYSNPFADIFGEIKKITNEYAAERGLPIPYADEVALDMNVPNDTEAQMQVPGLEFIVTEVKQERVKVA